MTAVKRFFALLILALSLCAPVAAFADDLPSARARTDQAGAADKSEEDSGDNGQGGTEVIDNFFIGMDKKAGKEAGAKPADDPDRLLLNLSWKEAEWETILTYKGNEMVTMTMRTGIDNSVLMGVLGYMKNWDYKALRATGVGGKEVAFHKLKAQGKDDDALEAAFDEALGAFADADGGKFAAVFCHDETLDALAESAKKKIDEKAAMKNEGNSVVYVLQMDKKDDKMLLLMSTLGTINAQ
jgi:hypothetical protein